MSAWDLRLGDCLDPVTGLASLPDKSVDVVITDPPYGEHIYKKHTGNVSGGVVQCPSMLELSSWDGINESIGTLTEHFLRLARRWVAVFSDEETSHAWMLEMGSCYVRAGAWVRSDPVSLNASYPARGLESLTIGHAAGETKRWNGGQNRAAVYTGMSLSGSRGKNERLGHPCPKPIWLMNAVVSDFTDPGDLILDPFAGSGTTGVAAIRLGRRFIGWEKDPKYHAIATKRLAGTKEQLVLGGPRTKPKQERLL